MMLGSWASEQRKHGFKGLDTRPIGRDRPNIRALHATVTLVLAGEEIRVDCRTAPRRPQPLGCTRARLRTLPRTAVPAWQQRPRSRCPPISLPAALEFEALPGGLTNRNYRFVDAERPSGRGAASPNRTTALLAIDRDAEYRNASIAAAHGVGPAVLGYAPGQGVSVVEWIDGRTFDAADLDDSGDAGETGCGLPHLLHSASPRFVTDFDMVAIYRRYLAIVHANGYRIPSGYEGYEELARSPEADRVSTGRRSHCQTVPCHNDMLAANIMDDGTRLWLIDYEYSGNNDPCFELGNIASEAHLSHDRLRELVHYYFGHDATSLRALLRASTPERTDVQLRLDAVGGDPRQREPC